MSCVSVWTRWTNKKWGEEFNGKVSETGRWCKVSSAADDDDEDDEDELSHSYEMSWKQTGFNSNEVILSSLFFITPAFFFCFIFIFLLTLPVCLYLFLLFLFNCSDLFLSSFLPFSVFIDFNSFKNLILSFLISVIFDFFFCSQSEVLWFLSCLGLYVVVFLLLCQSPVFCLFDC